MNGSSEDQESSQAFLDDLDAADAVLEDMFRPAFAAGRDHSQDIEACARVTARLVARAATRRAWESAVTIAFMEAQALRETWHPDLPEADRALLEARIEIADKIVLLLAARDVAGEVAD